MFSTHLNGFSCPVGWSGPIGKQTAGPVLFCRARQFGKEGRISGPSEKHRCRQNAGRSRDCRTRSSDVSYCGSETILLPHSRIKRCIWGFPGRRLFRIKARKSPAASSGKRTGPPHRRGEPPPFCPPAGASPSHRRALKSSGPVSARRMTQGHPAVTSGLAEKKNRGQAGLCDGVPDALHPG